MTKKNLINPVTKVEAIALARKYGINGPRGNMVVKEFLISNNIDIKKFKNPLFNDNKVRRSSLKMPGNFTLMVGTEKCFDNIYKDLFMLMHQFICFCDNGSVV